MIYPTRVVSITDIDKDMGTLAAAEEFAVGDRAVLFLKAVGGAATVRVYRKGGGGYYPDVEFETIAMADNSIWAVFNSPRYGSVVKVEPVTGTVKHKLLEK